MLSYLSQQQLRSMKEFLTFVSSRKASVKKNMSFLVSCDESNTNRNE